MARERTSPQRPGSKKRPSGTNTRKARPKRITSSALADAINRLKGLVERRQQDMVTASWDLGDVAAAVLQQAKLSGDTQLTTRKLAEDIGLIRKPDSTQKKTGDSTLRQMIKFADRVPRNTAARLQRAGVSWRGVVYWLGVKDKRDSQQLCRLMQSGLRDGTEIRRHIEAHFDKKVRPRMSPDVAVASDKVRAKAGELIAALEEFVKVYERQAEASAGSEPRAARTQLRQLAKTLDQTGKTLKATQTMIERR